MLLLVVDAHLHQAGDLRGGRNALANSFAKAHRRARGRRSTRSLDGRVRTPRLGRGCRGPWLS